MANAYPLVEFSDITFGQEIGRGGFGVVYKAYWQGRTVAVKDFHPEDEVQREKLEKELTQSFRIKKHQHPNIIDLFGVSVKNHYTYLLMEYACGGSLQQFLFGGAKKEYTTKRAISWMYQCAKGVEFLHGMQPKPLLHRDLKPSQLLLTENYETLRICGFRSVTELKTTMTENIGTLAWMAPELFGNRKYTEKCDVFSFAIILWEVFTREEYSKTFNSHWAIPIQVVQGHRPELKDEWPDELKHLMTSCWHENPSERPCMKDVVLKIEKLLVHHWFNGLAVAIDGAEGNERIPTSSTLQDHLCRIKTPSEMRYRYLGDIEKIPALTPLTSFNNIKMEEELGRGGFGIVYKANWEDRVIAVKDFCPHDVKDREDLKKELTQSFRIMKLQHPNIIDVYGVSVNNDHTYLLLEYASGGSLHQVLFGKKKQEYTTKRAISWMHQCAQGVAFLHASKLLHRDLKPDNLLLTDETYKTLKICDFGKVSELKTTMTQNTGTLAWIAPEVFGNTKYTQKCDVYSFAIILWEVFSREKYSKTFNSEWAIPEQVRKGGRPDLKDEWPEKLKHLMNSCWHENPSERPCMKDVVLKIERLLVHHWFNGLGDAIDGAKENEITPSTSTSQDYPFKIKPPSEMRIVGFIEPIKEILVQEQLKDVSCSCTRISFSSIEKEAFEKGWFGITYKAQVEVDGKTKILALKVYNRNYSNMDDKLYMCYSSISQHPLAPPLLDLYFTFSHERKIYYGLEYVEGGSLYNILHFESEPYTKMDALDWLTMLAVGLSYFHKHSICVNMLTSRNLFIDRSGKLKIGLPAGGEKADICKTTYKSAAWMSPEVHEDGKYSTRSDIYSFGIIIWEIINRQIPFKDFKPDQIAEMVKTGERPPLKEDENESIKELLKSCWERDPGSRPIANSVYYILKKQIGRGRFGTVYKADWRNKVIAVKDFFPINELDHQELEKELKQSFGIGKHRNIIEFYGVSVRDGHTYLFLEYAHGGSLHGVLFGSKKMEYTTEKAISWMYQCAQGVAFLHATKPKPLLHRDLKPANFLLTDSNCKTLKICDFGTVRELKTIMTENTGSLAWTAPELFGNRKYTEKCDVFSFAIIMWEVFTREEYFRSFNSHWAIPMQVVQGHRPELKGVIPYGIQTLMISCWKEDPSERPYMKDVVVEMESLLKTYSSNGARPRIEKDEQHPTDNFFGLRVCDVGAEIERMALAQRKEENRRFLEQLKKRSNF